MVSEAKRKEHELAQAEYNKKFVDRRNLDLEEAKQEVKDTLERQQAQLQEDQALIAGMQEMQFSEHEKMLALRHEIASAHRAEEEARKRVANLRLREAVRAMLDSLKEKQRRVSMVQNEDGLEQAVREKALAALSASLHNELDQAKHLQRRASTDLRVDLTALQSSMPSPQASGTMAPRGTLAMPSGGGGAGGEGVPADVLAEMMELQIAMEQGRQLMTDVKLHRSKSSGGGASPGAPTPSVGFGMLNVDGGSTSSPGVSSSGLLPRVPVPPSQMDMGTGQPMPMGMPTLEGPSIDLSVESSGSPLRDAPRGVVGSPSSRARTPGGKPTTPAEKKATLLSQRHQDRSKATPNPVGAAYSAEKLTLHPPFMANQENDSIVSRDFSIANYQHSGYTTGSNDYIDLWREKFEMSIARYSSLSQLRRAVATVIKAHRRVTNEIAFCALTETRGSVSEAVGHMSDGKFAEEMRMISSLIDVRPYFDRLGAATAPGSLPAISVDQRVSSSVASVPMGGDSLVSRSYTAEDRSVYRSAEDALAQATQPESVSATPPSAQFSQTTSPSNGGQASERVEYEAGLNNTAPAALKMTGDAQSLSDEASNEMLGHLPSITTGETASVDDMRSLSTHERMAKRKRRLVQKRNMHKLFTNNYKNNKPTSLEAMIDAGIAKRTGQAQGLGSATAVTGMGSAVSTDALLEDTSVVRTDHWGNPALRNSTRWRYAQGVPEQGKGKATSTPSSATRPSASPKFKDALVSYTSSPTLGGGSYYSREPTVNSPSRSPVRSKVALEVSKRGEFMKFT